MFPTQTQETANTKGDRRCANMCKHANTGHPMLSAWLRFQRAEELPRLNYQLLSLIKAAQVESWSAPWGDGWQAARKLQKGGRVGVLVDTFLTDLTEKHARLQVM